MTKTALDILPGGIKMKTINNSEKAYTLIIGCGRLGSSLANELSDKDSDVLIIDRNKDSFRKLAPSYGGLTLMGDATDFNVLNEAQIKKVTRVIAVTDNDNTNIMLAQISKAHFNIARVIIRLYDPERTCIYNGMGIETISPLLLSIKEISSMIDIGKETSDEKASSFDR